MVNYTDERTIRFQIVYSIHTEDNEILSIHTALGILYRIYRYTLNIFILKDDDVFPMFPVFKHRCQSVITLGHIVKCIRDNVKL